jgi:hypothetical protein
MKRRIHSLGRWGGVIALLAGSSSMMATASLPSHCPDLAGTYSVTQTAWIDRLHLNVTGTVRPTRQSPQLATLRPREGGYTLTWHMPRKALLAAADLLSARDPRQYGLWLDMVLRDPPTSTDGLEQQDWMNRIAFLGPVFRADAVLPFKQCEDGWYLLGTQSRAGAPDMEGGMDGNRNAQLWLQRRSDGALALRWRERRKLVVIRESRYTTESAIPLWSSDHLVHWPAAPAGAGDLTPLREAEMPSRNRPPKCRVVTEQENEFFKRLDAILPAGATQTNRKKGGMYIGRMRPDGTCEPMIYYVTITAPGATDFAPVETFLKADPFFARMESGQSDARPDGKLTRIFKMMVVP